MPGRLLESSRPRRWSVRSALPSVVFHAVLVLLAVRATARATDVFRDKDPDVHFMALNLPEAAPSDQSGGGPRGVPTAARSRPAVAPPSLNISPIVPPAVPIPDVSGNPLAQALSPHTGDFKGGVSGPGNSFGDGGPGGHGPGVGGRNGDPFGSDQVDRQAYMIPGSLNPAYPEIMRSSAIEGTVVAQFIVDSIGRVERSSIKILSATNEAFAAAVRAALPKGRFVPAESGGQKVRQLVQQTFTFTLK